MTVLVGISGGSGSGKSTLAQTLAQALRPGAALVLSEDWYYRDVAAIPGFDPATYDFDDIAARDHARLAEDLIKLRGGARVSTPRYAFARHARELQEEPFGPAEVLILEGAHLLCSEAILSLLDIRVFIDAPADIRLLRRLVRDQRERGRTLASIVEQYLRTVRPAHERLTEPSRRRADYILLDESGAIEAPSPGTLRRLVAPVLRDARLAPFLSGERDDQTPPAGPEAS